MNAQYGENRRSQAFDSIDTFREQQRRSKCLEFSDLLADINAARDADSSGSEENIYDPRVSRQVLDRPSRYAKRIVEQDDDDSPIRSMMKQKTDMAKTTSEQPKNTSQQEQELMARRLSRKNTVQRQQAAVNQDPRSAQDFDALMKLRAQGDKQFTVTTNDADPYISPMLEVTRQSLVSRPNLDESLTTEQTEIFNRRPSEVEQGTTEEMSAQELMPSENMVSSVEKLNNISQTMSLYAKRRSTKIDVPDFQEQLEAAEEKDRKSEECKDKDDKSKKSSDQSDSEDEEAFIKNLTKEINQGKERGDSLKSSRDMMKTTFIEETQIKMSIDFIKNNADHDDNKEECDYVKLVDTNERNYLEHARKKIDKKQHFSLQNVKQDEQYKQDLITSPQALPNVSLELLNRRRLTKCVSTCVALTDDLIIIGNTDGSLYSYDRDNESLYSVYQNKDKDWVGNAITCIDVHPLRTEYVLVGYQKGQIVLIDMTEPKKALKTIKDVHKGVAVASVKFCDWIKEREATPAKTGISIPLIQNDESDGKQPDKQLWMFVSLDCEGKAFINTISKSLIGFSTSKFPLCDPKKEGLVALNYYQTVAPRFFNKSYPQGEINDSCTFVALGGPSEVKLYMITKDNYSLHFTFKHPVQYINKETDLICDIPQKAPAMCWGFGRTPVFKFDSFSLLAISWGPLIQLVALVDITQPEEDFIADGHYLLTQNYSNKLQQHQEAFVESMRFLNESLLIVITENYEVRILYTCKFSHGKFISPDEMVRINQDGQVDPRQSAALQTEWRQQMKEVELQRDKHIEALSKSEYGQIGEQTVSVFQDTLIALDSKGQVNQLRHYYWKESLGVFRKQVQGDWIKVFARALDIYQGNVKGFKGIEDNDEIRQEIMKAELKLLIKELIADVIERWRQGKTTSVFTPTEKNMDTSRQSLEDDSMADIKECLNTLDEKNQDEMTKNYRTLIRIAIEFCVEMQNPTFLFQDLFTLFMDESMEWLMVTELTPFILAGKFSGWELYEEIIEENIMKFQKQIFMQSALCCPAANLEKMIINLNFNLCSKEYVQDLIQFCEENYLTTGLFYLCINTLPQSEVASVVLTKLRDMYLTAQKHKNEGSKRDLKLLVELPINSEEKIPIERKSVYLGYKLLWAIKLFYSGKNFPSGNIKQDVWNCYIHDVSDIITRNDFMITLFEIDASAFFTILSVIFYSGQQFEFIKNGRKDEAFIKGDVVAMDHNIIMTRLSTYCQSQFVEKHVRLQYLFFVANVASKSEIKQAPSFYYSVVIDLIKHTEEYIDYNKNLSKSSVHYSTKMMKQVTDLIKKKGFTQSKYVWISENNILNLLKMSEPLDDGQINELIEHIYHTQFDHIKHILYEKREDYLMCLKLLMRGVILDYQKPPDVAAFDWIKDKLDLLQSRIRIHNDQTMHEHKYDQLRREVIANMGLFIEISPKLTVELVDDRFEGDHTKIIQSLNQDKKSQLKYIVQIITGKQIEIQETIENYSLRKQDSEKAQIYIQILQLHLELTCQLKPEKVMSLVEKLCRQTYYPLDQCQKICQQNNQVEASALLNKKIGSYYESIQQYVWVLNNKIDCDVLKHEIAMLFKKKNDYSIEEFDNIKFQHMHNINLLERIIKKIIKICDKHPEEVLSEQQEALHQGSQQDTVWKYVLDSLIQIKHHKKIHKRDYSKNFIQEHINKFVNVLLKTITFKEIADHVVKQQPDLEYSEIKQLIEHVLHDAGSSYLIHNSACSRIFADTYEQSTNMANYKGSGLHFTYRICNLCNKRLDLSRAKEYARDVRRDDYQNSAQSGAVSSDEEDEFNREDPFNERMYVFQCHLSPYNHTFHKKCLKRFIATQQSEPEKRQNGLSEEEILKNLRCPDCFKKNYDISGTSARNQRRGKIIGTASERSSHSGTSSSSNKSKPGLTRKMTRIERHNERRNIVMDNKMADLGKRMSFFDEHHANKETLTIENFIN